MALSELQEQKMTRMFSVYDHDGNGFLEEEDYRQIIDNLAAVRGWDPRSDAYRELSDRYMVVWNTLRQAADQAPSDGRVSLDEVLAYNDRLISDPALFETHVEGLAKLLFDTLDEDGDGVITAEEYRRFAGCLRMDEAVGGEAFARMDVAGSGRITREQIIERVQEFYHSDDPNAPGNWLFGPYESAGVA